MSQIATLDAGTVSLISGVIVTIIGAVTSAVISIINLVARNKAESQQQAFNLELKRQAELDRLAAETRTAQTQKAIADAAAAQDKLAAAHATEVKKALEEKDKSDADKALVIKEAVDLVNGGVAEMQKKFSGLQVQSEELKTELFRLRNAGQS